jgi:hypothetical protein
MEPVSTKPQKSSFWLWTTLWLTAFIDSGLIFSVFSYAVSSLPEGTPLFLKATSMLVVLLISLWLGAYFAVNYVLKKSIVLKTSADKLASLAIVIPVLFWAIKLWIGTLDVTGVVAAALSIFVIYWSIKKMILAKGD